MKAKTTLSMTEARKNIFKISDEVQKPGNYYTFTENGIPKIVVMSAEEFESWQETFDVLRENPNLKNEIKSARKEFKKGQYVPFEKILKKEHVQNSGKKNSRKRAK
ncbi:type II toxin-antitoxin system Phd/YefM family antitoxin [Candidatus Gracilibacteria bacterium]|nr:type II toxin-antitoxin system Phd/YefM family antitoxin [Candidatus Gracilibacteria bacterium]